MLRVVTLLGVLGMTSVAFADPPAAAPPAPDLDKVQGAWKPLQCQYEGKPQMPTEVMEQVRVVFENGEYFLYFKDSKQTDKDGKPVILRLAHANISLDPNTTPKSITFEFADGPLKGKKSHGIYEVAGNELKMCYGPSDKPKPAKFESAAGTGYFFEKWVRQEKK